MRYQLNIEFPPMSSHKHSRKCRAPCRLLSLILPDKIARRIFPSTPTSIDGPRATHDLNVLHVNRVSSRDKRPETINILPDDVLLHIFLFYRLTYLENVYRFQHLSWTWYRLVHVCRRWRTVVFAWPNFLDLKLFCSPTTNVELWPPFPIIIGHWNRPMHEDHGTDAAIVHHNRICEIKLPSITTCQLEQLASEMQEPFPQLTCLLLGFDGHYDTAPALPDGFLGGSAPRLQSLSLASIPFPALPNLLLSATDLVRLAVHDIYFVPEAIVTGLAASANLQFLSIGLISPPGREGQHPPPPIRVVLPALTSFVLHGTSEHLEDFVARIDAPLLDEIRIVFYYPPTFDTPQFAQFVRRTPKFQALKEAHVTFDYGDIYIEFPTQSLYEMSSLIISCDETKWRISSLVPYFASFFPSICVAESLFLNERPFPPTQSPYLKNTHWLEILRPFTAVKNFYLCNGIAPRIALVLQELVEARMLEVLPTLQNVFLEGLRPGVPILPGLGNFVYTRQLAGHPIKVLRWVRHDWVLVG